MTCHNFDTIDARLAHPIRGRCEVADDVLDATNRKFTRHHQEPLIWD